MKPRDGSATPDRMLEPHTPVGLLPAPHEGRLWLGVALPVVAWVMAELTGYFANARLCHAAGPFTDGMAGTRLVLLGIQAAALTMTVAGALIAYRILRRTGESTGNAGIADTRVRFMAFAGIVASAFAAVSIILFFLMPLLVHPCMRST